MPCSSANTTFTNTELNAQYPNSVFAQLSIQSNNALSATDISSWISALQSSRKLPTLPTSSNIQDISAYTTAVSTFISGIENEYCYYESRYKFSLMNLLTKLSMTPNTGLQEDISMAIITTSGFNTRLNRLISLIREIRNRNTTTNSHIITDLIKNAESLTKQAEILNSKTATTDLYKRMMEYSEEKNRANKNLLSLYSFLNIVALGMLVYVYRASST